MKIKYFFLLFLVYQLIIFPNKVIGQKSLETKFEKSKGLETVTYPEGISYFKLLAEKFPEIDIREMGETDSGHPLHLVIFSGDRDFNFSSLKKKSKSIILVNNAIHPREPDGVDASMLLLRDLAKDNKAKEKYNEVVLVIIPFYNIGGALNRNSYTRVNQNGPRSYGFRGNAQNIDLNRDFIKMDSKNARSFARIFHEVDPDIFIDNHVSNGADYQHVMTMLETQPNKLGGALGNYLETKLRPRLEKEMADRKFEMAPYVNVWDKTPDAGYSQFLDLPRYSSGYTTLFHTIGFVPETHMLKTYKDRVAATYAFMEAMMKVVQEEGAFIRYHREQTKKAVPLQEEFTIDWKHSIASYRQINFKGYEGSFKESKVTGQKRLFYDRNKPFEKIMPFYDLYIPKTTVKKPKAYLVPQGWHEIIERLKVNKVNMQEIERDTTIEIEAYVIEDYKTVEKPYEGHYLHYDTQVTTQKCLYIF
jgi:hypothetical protein